MSAKALFLGSQVITVPVTDQQQAIIHEWQSAHIDDLRQRLEGTGLSPDTIVRPRHERIVFLDDTELLKALAEADGPIHAFRRMTVGDPICPPLPPGEDETCTHTPTCPTQPSEPSSERINP